MTPPNILEPGTFSAADVSHLKQTQRIFEIVDVYEQQLRELFMTLHAGSPAEGSAFEHFKKARGVDETAGAWVYYPWSGVLLHCVAEVDLLTLRTNRNQLLITKDEQQALRQAVVGIAGMSVGAGMAVAAAYSGMSRTIKLADFDELDTTNLNRLREPLAALGKPKVELAAQHIYNLDPFADVQVFGEGLTAKTIDQFFTEPKLTVVIDEIDDFAMKVQMRLHAQKHRVPLIMFTSLGDNILVDVERYDSDQDQQPFNNLVPELSQEILAKKEISDADAKRYAVQLVGAQYVPTRALDSLTKMGTELLGRPQLYSTIAIDGGLAAYVIKRLVLYGDIQAGRYFVRFGELFKVVNDDLEESAERTAILHQLIKPRST